MGNSDDNIKITPVLGYMNVHIYQNSLTFDNLHQCSQIFHLIIHYETLTFVWKGGNIRPAWTHSIHKSSKYRNI